MDNHENFVNFQKKWVLVTGATGHLGQSICETMTKHGANLILVDHPCSDFASTVSKLKDLGDTELVSFACDLEDENSRDQLISSVLNYPASLDSLINNAAFVGSADLEGWSAPFKHQRLDTWRRAIEVNLTAPFHLSQGFADQLALAEDGNIVNVCSIYGMLGPDWRLYDNLDMASPAGYAASKGGLIQLSRWLSTTLAPSIRVNSVSPGGISRGQPKDFVSRYNRKVPLQRMAQEGDVVNSIIFLASGASSYVSGQNISVDGGWSAW